ncbi:cobB/CobQ-like glutamine amidotransferase domain protein [Mycobacterium xenopi 4042]|uniref:CobB/CobQ-like glutamine amidotransferase domain protein n=1 Tax=Mycobacterium xenopi 4042 TaxID=1299334 RepID=X8E706_MYCXE|nr:cobB/CobQ-like glutamine amidotransferase domain protein [Mycobacterium xenopi 4042]
MAEQLIGPLYAHGAAGADIAVVEGVMGLFDGRIGLDAATPAPVPPRTSPRYWAPGDPGGRRAWAKPQHRRAAARVFQLRSGYPHRRCHPQPGRIGPAPAGAAASLPHAGVPVLGAIPRSDEIELPTRHLGLITAVEHGRRAQSAVEAMTALVTRHVDVAAVAAAAASRVADPAWDPAAAIGEVERRPVTVALAAGKAFSFSYAEHAELLRAAGAEVVEFDPCVDSLPDGSGAVVLPGGFPEQFPAELSANTTARQQIYELAAAGAPVHAECGGLTYLVSDLDGHPMCGVLAGSARFTAELSLGYRDAVAVADSTLFGAGQRVVGHEFHRTAVTFTDAVQPAWVYRDGQAHTVRDGAVHAGVHASYLHTHPAATPGAVARFVAHAAQHGSKLAG